MIDRVVISAFVSELEKTALNPSTLQSYLSRRAAQGVGGAKALGESLVGSAAQTSRQAVQGMSGLQKHRLSGVVEGGQAARQMERLPKQVGLANTTQETRQRVSKAIQHEAAHGGSRTGGVPLSRSYEGYATDSRRSYNPEHIGKVMGLGPEQQYVSKKGPTALMKPSASISQSGVQERPTGATPITVPVSPAASSADSTKITRPARRPLASLAALG